MFRHYRHLDYINFRTKCSLALLNPARTGGLAWKIRFDDKALLPKVGFISCEISRSFL